jgi:phosphatidylserine/phosphatidylglycerophosphate/cardiolipin synthase-like enzyme
MLVLASAVLAAKPAPAPSALDAAPVASALVRFSPRGWCSDAILATLAKAKVDIRVQAYNFTAPAVADALIAARKRGCRVEVIVDQKATCQKTCQLEHVFTGKCVGWVDGKHPIAHNKVMVIDSRWVITGSYNFSTAAELANAENLLVLDSPALATAYLQNWCAHREHSTAFQPGK